MVLLVLLWLGMVDREQLVICILERLKREAIQVFMPTGMQFLEGWVMGNDLDIPENSREIALHLRNIQANLQNNSNRVEALERAVGARINGLETTLNTRIDNV